MLISTVESLERKISSSIRKWLGLPRSLSSTALYGKTNPIQLPVKGVVEEFKVSRTREAIMYKNSKDPKVANAGISIHTGKKWDVRKELRSAEERLKMKAIIGTVAEGTMGLGYIQREPIDKTDTKEYQKLLQNEVRASVEEDRMTKMVGLFSYLVHDPYSLIWSMILVGLTRIMDQIREYNKTKTHMVRHFME